MKAALIQMPVFPDREKNLSTARAEILRAAELGADFAVLPEMFCCPYDNRCFRAYGETHGGRIQQVLSRTAEECGIYVVGGSLPELEDDRVYNTCFVYDRKGYEIARHRKAHLFDINVSGGQQFRESDVLSAGSEITVFDTEFGPMGLCICFDMRFEELIRCMALRGAKVIFVPAAFNMTTGPAHWELLFRQRAIDNQCFTVGVSPARNEQASYVAYGNSIAADPWGQVLTRAKGDACTLLTELDLSKIACIRAELPILSARRTDLYEVLEK